MPLDQILLPALAVVGGFLVVMIASRLLARPNRPAVPQIFQAAAPPPSAPPADPLDVVAEVIAAKHRRAIIEWLVATHVDTLVNRDTRDIAAGYAPQAGPGAPSPNS